MKIIDLSAYLREHSYPGRGILLGRSADNKHAVIAYFIMGRSANSRNRVFTPVEEDDGIRTEAYDPSQNGGSQPDYLRTPCAVLREPATPWSPTATRPTPCGTALHEGKIFAQALRSPQL